MKKMFEKFKKAIKESKSDSFFISVLKKDLELIKENDKYKKVLELYSEKIEDKFLDENGDLKLLEFCENLETNYELKHSLNSCPILEPRETLVKDCICGHVVEFRYFGNNLYLDLESAEESEVEHVKGLIMENYNQGELFLVINEEEYRGWWSIL